MMDHRLSQFALPAALTGALLGVSCSGGGGDGIGPGGGDPPGGGGPSSTPVDIDFALRRALRPDSGMTAGPVIDGTVGEINGDGAVDAVLLDFDEATASVLLGDGSGEFTETTVLALPGIPTAVEIADTSGDGLADLVVALVEPSGSGGLTGSPASLAVYEQLSEGGFQADPSATAGLPGLVLSILPIPGAGAGSDLLAVLPGPNAVHRLSSTGGALVETEVIDSSAIGLGTPLTAVVLDVAGDGTLDLVVGESDRLVIYPGDGAGGFGEAELLLAPVDVAILCCVEDANGDGLDDLAVAQLTATDALLLLNGPFGLDSLIEIELGVAATAITFPDLNDDGLPDLVAGLLDEGSVEVRIATATLSFGEGRRYEAGPAPRRVHALDLDGDADMDLVCTNGVDMAFLHNEGDGVLRSAEAFEMGELSFLPFFLEAADLDGDGAADVATIDLLQRAVVFHRGRGDGAMDLAGEVSLAQSAIELPSYLLLVDLDEDGDLDILTAVTKTSEVVLLRNEGALPFPPPAPADRTSVSLTPLGLAAGDVDGDGDLDVVVAGSEDHELELLFGDGSGDLTAGPVLSLAARPLAVALLDLDLDGDLDALVTTGEDDGQDAGVLVLAGDGAGGFALADTIPVTAPGTQVAVDDLDADGLPDAVIGQFGEYADSLIVLRNQGDLELVAQAIEVGPSPGAVAIRDIDEDGVPDICVPTSTGVFQILLGDGLGGFAFSPDTPEDGFSIPWGTTGASIADLDGDGHAELVLVSPLYGSLWVGLNRSTPAVAAP